MMDWQAVADTVTAPGGGDNGPVWGAVGALITAAGAWLLAWLRRKFGRK
jgi:hypothetical protein